VAANSFAVNDDIVLLDNVFVEAKTRDEDFENAPCFVLVVWVSAPSRESREVLFGGRGRAEITLVGLRRLQNC
jgi:hypothetical protein